MSGRGCGIAGLLLLVCLGAVGPAVADEVRVAVASNFTRAARELAVRFASATGHEAVLSFGSTGKHYAQIVNGAPFGVFLAADAERPRRLEAEGRALAGSRFTYALGRLVLWSPRTGVVDTAGAVLEHGDFRHLALANPRLAPYGRAAEQVLIARGLRQALAGRLVLGENIGQAHRFVASGSAELGFVALAQVVGPGGGIDGSWWEPPRGLAADIVQQAVLLRDSPAARAFVAFLRGDEARMIIHNHGYGLP